MEGVEAQEVSHRSTHPRPRKQKDYTLLLSSTRDRAAKIITREDGFEKRYFWRCGRCKVVYGYQLDDIHYPSTTAIAAAATTTTATTTTTAAAEDKGKVKDGARVGHPGCGRKRKDYVYFLPGALLLTEELGREVGDGETVFPEVGGE